MERLGIEFRREGLNFLISNARSTGAEGLPHHEIFEVSLRYRFRLVLDHLALWEGDKLCFGGNWRKSPRLPIFFGLLDPLAP